MNEFKVGKRVRNRNNGLVGTIRSIDKSSISERVGVEYDKRMGGHELSTTHLNPPCKSEHGWWEPESDLEVLDDENKQEFKFGEVIEVTDDPTESYWEKNIFVSKVNDKYLIAEQSDKEELEQDYEDNSCTSYTLFFYSFARKCPDAKEMTKADIEKELGYSIKIVEEY